MTTIAALMQAGLSTGYLLLVLAASFAVMLGALYFVFRLLKRSVKMAFRIALVISVAAVLLVGSISLWWFGIGGTSKSEPKAPAKRSRAN